jgi:hypothetical protein
LTILKRYIHWKADALKIGTVIYEPKRVEGFDLFVYYVKRADGAIGKPARDMFNDITCFADAKTVRERPELVAVSNRGAATRSNKFFTLPFDFVCPNHEEYRANLLHFIKCVSKENVSGVILNLYHFPEEGFCTCKRCFKEQKKSGLAWKEWRTKVVTDFIKTANKLVVQRFAVEIWPDPVLANERFGLDFNSLAPYVDFFHVPLSSQNYLTFFWVDTLTRDFKKLLKRPLYVELSGEISGEIETKALLKTMAYVSRDGVDAILLLSHTADRLKEICKTAVHDINYRNWLDKFEFQNMIKIVEKWERIY